MQNHQVRLPDYAQTIGVQIDGWDGARPILALDYADKLCGNPGMFHGGAVSALLEMAAVATLEADLAARQASGSLAPINTTVEFLRVAGEERTYASAEIVKAGRRLANVSATLWQGERAKPVATAIVNIAIGQG